ncbi:hypothetical protein CYLTODRAFT_417664 [Cylindrobasidium torrendii FP15055 ss-10]|uniref:Uncharacterized protein n=1 Tax=Cylindrobasidium torrendii FP15055 ss-10 TaxID=1314674 RepID=A0A0D7BSR6_9AGAR|nr:hypothetical protein CYLTODRAFT_417664 [Cylindrobasidium torrendii FP15055 ss-10]
MDISSSSSSSSSCSLRMVNLDATSFTGRAPAPASTGVSTVPAAIPAVQQGSSSLTLPPSPLPPPAARTECDAIPASCDLCQFKFERERNAGAVSRHKAGRICKDRQNALAYLRQTASDSCPIPAESSTPEPTPGHASRHIPTPASGHTPASALTFGPIPAPAPTFAPQAPTTLTHAERVQLRTSQTYTFHVMPASAPPPSSRYRPLPLPGSTDATQTHTHQNDSASTSPQTQATTSSSPQTLLHPTASTPATLPHHTAPTTLHVTTSVAAPPHIVHSPRTCEFCGYTFAAAATQSSVVRHQQGGRCLSKRGIIRTSSRTSSFCSLCKLPFLEGNTPYSIRQHQAGARCRERRMCAVDGDRKQKEKGDDAMEE